ncbi:TetR/AcrR family transcriptional regulator [Wukongibacter sp. M2B1]|uniref:TetR/AcrR family transcriptional regulator n=1 Tax=Wukongibacter sp. M2B1 TaxID=3088895 RepID=UPI003D7A20F4
MGLKEKILEASYELFASKGYDKTTVSDIIKMAGSSRGGFYHHFNSKEEILEAITGEYLDKISKLYNTIIEEHVGSYTEIFNKILTIFYKYKVGQIKDWPKLQKIFSFKGNHAIILKLARDFEEITKKVYTRIIKEGVEQGEFILKYPEALAGLWTREIIQINRIARKEFFKNNEAKFKSLTNQLEFTENMINRELGLEDNTIKLKLIILAYIEETKEQIALEEDAK